jgi:tryptophanyl-tRNA synthetase
MARIFSGIQSTGDPHIGNYLGAIRQWVREQNKDALYCVVDLHAMTVPFDAETFADTTRRTVMFLLAAGLDPQRCTLFVQSHVRQHSELTWIFNCVATMGELRRMTQFKERRPVRLPGAHGRRHPRVRHHLGARGRRPAPAPRTGP